MSAPEVPARRGIVRQVLRNTLLAVVTVIGLQLELLLSGAVLTETIFALPGLGRLVDISYGSWVGRSGGDRVWRRTISRLC
jgi:ABC-type dipeptide/oligopeptide/nickel transport system permease component